MCTLLIGGIASPTAKERENEQLYTAIQSTTYRMTVALQAKLS